MQKRQIALLLSSTLVAACQASPSLDPGAESQTSGPTPDPTQNTSGTSGTPTPQGEEGPGEEAGEEEDSGGDPPIVYDVHGVGGGFCEERMAGIYCSDNTAIECDDSHNEVMIEECVPAFCEGNVGCLPCLEGMFDCQGPHVVRCDTSVLPHVWERIDTCDPAAGEGCDLGSGTCSPLSPLGGTEPTGEYFQYVDFQSADGFNGGYDVDGFQDRLYVTNFSQSIDVYEVEVFDSDGDGAVEPNQHPENPEELGPVEQRELTFIESMSIGGTVSISTTELFVQADRIFIGGNTITETIFDGGDTATITSAPAWANRFSMIGYDEVNGVWYGANESFRRVMQHDGSTDEWGLAFYYPELAGSHMDGLEVVVDPNTGTPFVYVSDMTSDFIGQYRKDTEDGWVQENLFEYEGTIGAAVEGMGFGPQLHFWVTSGNGLAEVGGGDLQEFVEPAPTG